MPLPHIEEINLTKHYIKERETGLEELPYPAINYIPGISVKMLLNYETTV